MAITYDYYRIFYAVAQYSSFTRAAEALDNNQPNITRCMNILEHELGCKLFIRSNRGITLTPEGKRLYDHVATAVEQIRLGEEELHREVGMQQGIVTIGASETALNLLLLERLSAFHDRYPGIRLRIFNYTTPQSIDALQKGLLDCAAITAPFQTTGTLRATPLIRFREILLGGTKFRHLADQLCHLKDLSRYSLICPGSDTSTYHFYQRFYLKYDCPFHVDMETATMDQVLPMVRHNLGIGFYSEMLASESIARKEVYQIHLVEPVPDRVISLIEDTSRPQRTAVRELIRMITAGTPTG